MPAFRCLHCGLRLVELEEDPLCAVCEYTSSYEWADEQIMALECGWDVDELGHIIEDEEIIDLRDTAQGTRRLLRDMRRDALLESLFA